MATVHKPLVLLNGELTRLPVGDTISGVDASASVGFSAESGEAALVSAGTPVYIKSDGKAYKAQANAVATASVIGLASADVAIGASATIQNSGLLTLTDWTATAGAATLTPGARYYLSDLTAGTMVTIAPDLLGAYAVPIGRAVSSTALLIEIDSPIGC